MIVKLTFEGEDVGASVGESVGVVEGLVVGLAVVGLVDGESVGFFGDIYKISTIETGQV